ncbi:MAG: hypothetical protein ACRCXT_09110 [Paraclostridium sp.]
MNYKEHLTKNRLLKIEEYDDNGNLIDILEFSKDDLWWFCCEKGNSYRGLDVAVKSDREYFKGEELELFHEIIKTTELFRFCIVTEDIEKIDYIFRTYTKDQIRFALDFKHYLYNYLNYAFYGDDEVIMKNKNFIEILEWVKVSGGFYYAVDEKGNRGMAYLDKPTTKQASYQRQKHGKRIVFLSFKDFKEYLV